MSFARAFGVRRVHLHVRSGIGAEGFPLSEFCDFDKGGIRIQVC